MIKLEFPTYLALYMNFVKLDLTMVRFEQSETLSF